MLPHGRGVWLSLYYFEASTFGVLVTLGTISKNEYVSDKREFLQNVAHILLYLSLKSYSEKQLLSFSNSLVVAASADPF